MLFDWYYADQLSVHDLRHLLPIVWTMAEFPASYVGFDEWLELFWLTGFVTDRPGFKQPTEALTIYRGSLVEYRHRPSWTTNLMVAAWFRRRYNQMNPGGAHVFTATVAPEDILGMFFDREEDEVLVNISDLAMIEIYEGVLPTDDEVDAWHKQRTRTYAKNGRFEEC